MKTQTTKTEVKDTKKKGLSTGLQTVRDLTIFFAVCIGLLILFAKFGSPAQDTSVSEPEVSVEYNID